MTTALCGFCSGNNTTEIAVAANKHPIVTAALFCCVSEDGGVWQCSWLTRGRASPAMGWQAWLKACPGPPYQETCFLSTPWFSIWLVQPSSVISCVTGRREGVCSEQKSMRPWSSAGLAHLTLSHPAQPGLVFGLWQHTAASSSSHRACPAAWGTSLVGAGVGLPVLPDIALFRTCIPCCIAEGTCCPPGLLCGSSPKLLCFPEIPSDTPSLIPSLRAFYDMNQRHQWRDFQCFPPSNIQKIPCFF